MPKGMHHYMSFPEATVFQANGNGPAGITYLNPADDPRKTDLLVMKSVICKQLERWLYDSERCLGGGLSAVLDAGSRTNTRVRTACREPTHYLTHYPSVGRTA